MSTTKITERITIATRLATFGDTWPTNYATDLPLLVAALDDDEPIEGDRLAAIRSRVIDARGAFPWPGGRWAGWYADDASLLLEDLAVTAA